MKFRFPIVIIDEDFRSENNSGLGIRALADAIERNRWRSWASLAMATCLNLRNSNPCIGLYTVD